MNVTPQHIEVAQKVKSYYTACFSSPGGAHVLRDLMGICKARTTTVVAGDPYWTMVNEGRRQVWIHIQDMLGLTAEQIAALYAGMGYAPKQRTEDDV